MTSGAHNICYGYNSGAIITTGSNNILLGKSTNLGSNSLTDCIVIGTGASASASASIVIGNTSTHTTNFQAGIRGVTTGNADAIAVLVDSAHQLGTVSSSARYKENIEPVDDVDYLYNLNPVSFNYKNDESKKKVYGLIAEEVEEILPEIVVYKDIDGERVPDTVQYHVLSPLLLGMIKQQKEIIESLKERCRELM